MAADLMDIAADSVSLQNYQQDTVFFCKLILMLIYPCGVWHHRLADGKRIFHHTKGFLQECVI